MSSGDFKEKEELHEGGEMGEKHDVLHAEVLASADLMNDAFDAENREHEMGIWQAAKAHPMACFWAFLMCFTIVSLFPRNGFTSLSDPGSQIAKMTLIREEK